MTRYSSGDFAVIRNDDLDGRPPSRPFSRLLTSTHGQVYPFYVKDKVDSELKERDLRVAR
jgi:hypothetical protein